MTEKQMKLSATEAKVLVAWRDCAVGYGFPFKVAAKRSGVDEHKIRRAVRALARKGAVEFERSLWDECDGGMIGAGYVLTKVGSDYLDSQEERAA